jgi:hypothetical protein
VTPKKKKYLFVNEYSHCAPCYEEARICLSYNGSIEILKYVIIVEDKMLVLTIISKLVSLPSVVRSNKASSLKH